MSSGTYEELAVPSQDAIMVLVKPGSDVVIEQTASDGSTSTILVAPDRIGNLIRHLRAAQKAAEGK